MVAAMNRQHRSVCVSTTEHIMCITTLRPPPPPVSICNSNAVSGYHAAVCLSWRVSICHPCPCSSCYSRSSEVQSATLRLTDGLYPVPHLSVRQIKLASWPPEHTQHREGPRLRLGQIQFTDLFLLFSSTTRTVWSLFLFNGLMCL